MQDRRSRNIEIFKDTIKTIDESSLLNKSVEESISLQKFYPEGIDIAVPMGPMRNGETVLSKKRSLQAAATYAKEGKKVCVLNFASATTPGGGVVKGSSAQEESLCRISTLYPCLMQDIMWELFYEPHRAAGNNLYNDDCIYTPGVTVFKSDILYPEMMEEKSWYNVDILTVAAPNLRNYSNINFSGNMFANNSISNDELYNIQYNRICRIFQTAILNQAEVLILGAFGCGAFCNDPNVVARAFYDAQEEYGIFFDTIEYAIFCTDAECVNYEAFETVFHNS